MHTNRISLHRTEGSFKVKKPLFKLTLAAAAVSALALGGMANEAKAQTVNLPTANCGLTLANNCLEFGDFQVYSLGLLSYYQKPSNGFNLYQGFDFTYK